jgi:SAM-dependent methyltransferase
MTFPTEQHVPGQVLRTWEELAKRDPLWAILSAADRTAGGDRPWDPDEFLATGVAEIEDVLAYARARHPKLRTGRALDFGCGVGRLSQALAEHFDCVDAVDVAPSMVALAERLNRHGDRCRYHLNLYQSLSCFGDCVFDFVYSVITLQHMPPAVAGHYLDEFARVLAPDGLLIFQLPSATHRDLGSGRSAWRRGGAWLLRRSYLLWKRTLCRAPVMDIYGIDRAIVERRLHELGLRAVDVVADTRGGPHWKSFRYCAHKPRQ